MGEHLYIWWKFELWVNISINGEVLNYGETLFMGELSNSGLRFMNLGWNLNLFVDFWIFTALLNFGWTFKFFKDLWILDQLGL